MTQLESRMITYVLVFNTREKWRRIPGEEEKKAKK
jgi:hypothetical protein